MRYRGEPEAREAKVNLAQLNRVKGVHDGRAKTEQEVDALTAQIAAAEGVDPTRVSDPNFLVELMRRQADLQIKKQLAERAKNTSNELMQRKMETAAAMGISMDQFNQMSPDQQETVLQKRDIQLKMKYEDQQKQLVSAEESRQRLQHTEKAKNELIERLKRSEGFQAIRGDFEKLMAANGGRLSGDDVQLLISRLDELGYNTGANILYLQEFINWTDINKGYKLFPQQLQGTKVDLSDYLDAVRQSAYRSSETISTGRGRNKTYSFKESENPVQEMERAMGSVQQKWNEYLQEGDGTPVNEHYRPRTFGRLEDAFGPDGLEFTDRSAERELQQRIQQRIQEQERRLVEMEEFRRQQHVQEEQTQRLNLAQQQVTEGSPDLSASPESEEPNSFME